MKIVIVIPWIYAISGNITAIDLAEELADKGHEVDILVLELYEEVLSELKSNIHNSNLIYFRVTSNGKHGRLQYIINQIVRDLGRELLSEAKRRSIELDHDLILLISDEALSLGKLIRSTMGMKGIVSISVMELVEHNFFKLLKGENAGIVSFLVYPFYYLLHRKYKKYLQYYDLVFSNSEWTSIMVNYFYGIVPEGQIQSVHKAFLISELSEITEESNYIAVPTASLGKKEMQIVNKLQGEGINLVFYGPQGVESVDYKGFLTTSDMMKLVSNANSVLFLFDYEALGLIPLEALALGSPVITFRKQGPLLSTHNCSGISFVSNYDEILKACHDALKNKPTLNFRKVCRECVSHLNSTKAAEIVIEGYKKLTGYN